VLPKSSSKFKILKKYREDVKHDNRMFEPIFTFLANSYVLGLSSDLEPQEESKLCDSLSDSGIPNRFLSDCKLSMLLFDEFMYIVTRFLVFYQADEAVNTRLNVIGNASIHEIPLSKLRSFR